ncbi:unnamed protein product, partial [Heterosigma akashiwo]
MRGSVAPPRCRPRAPSHQANVARGKGLKNVGRSRTNLEADLELARDAGDHDKVEFLQKKLAELRAEEELKKRNLQEKMASWSKINKRNATQNFEVDVQTGNRKKAELDRLLARGTEQKSDPFARRATRPKVLWVTQGAKAAAAAAAKDDGGVEESKGDGEAPNGGAAEEKKAEEKNTSEDQAKNEQNKNLDASQILDA